MKKISLVLLCLLSALPILAHANWTEMGVSNGKSLYIDQTKTASIDGATKRAVILLSFDDPQPVPNGMPYQSTVSRIEADCRSFRLKFVANFYYSESMGKGSIVLSSNIPPQNQEWNYHPLILEWTQSSIKFALKSRGGLGFRLN